MFYLALSEGLDDDPIGAMERMVGIVERAGRRQGFEDMLQKTASAARPRWARFGHS